MDSKASVSGVKVSVLSGGSTVTSASTSSNGDYTVSFTPGKKYTVKYTKSGYVTKIIALDVTDVNGEEMPAGGKIFPPINLDLFTERPGIDFSFLETQPVVSWSFDNGNMTYNKGQMQAMKSKIEEKLAESANQAKNSDAEYNKLISEADALYSGKKYKEALNKYVAALQVPGKQKEAHPNSRLLEIEDLLQKQDEKELAYKQENQVYLNLIEAADNFASAKDYVKAMAKYEEAIAVKGDEQYPKDKVAELKEEVANAKKRAEYDKIVKRADGFLKQNSLKAARDAYQAALKIFPKEEYPAKQLADMTEKLDAQKALEEQKDKYNAAIKEADILYTAENFEEAILKYEEALTFESAATYPAGRIKMAQEIIDGKAAEAAKIESFNKLVAEADAHVVATEFENAVTKYTEAIALIEDPAVQTKLDNAKSLLAEQKKNAEQKEQIDALMASAKTNMDAETYAKAIEDYTAVLALNDKFPAAIEGKKKAEELLAKNQAQEEKDNQFNELVTAADKAFTAKTWQEAKEKYTEAKAIYDDREHVNNRIIEVEAMIAQAGVEEQIGELLASATEKVGSENYSGAITDYDAVLALKEDQKEAIEGKKNAEQLMADKESQQQQESAFNEVVAEADKAFDQENWAEAKEKYTAAKAIFDDREHVNTRLTEVEAALKNAAAQEESLAQIQTLLDEADALKPENKWNDVISKYEAALAIDSERKDVSDMLAAAKESKTAWEAEQSQAESSAQIQTLLDEADALKPENKWNDVISKYEAALALDTERQDVSDMLAAAKASKSEFDAAQSQGVQFEELKAEGNELLTQENWSEAKIKYESALEIQSDEEITANLEIIEEKLALAVASKNKEEEYNTKMSAGEESATNEDFQTALNSFKEALNIKENDPVAMSRIEDMQQKIEELALANSKNEQYEETMAQGKSAMTNEDYSLAVKAFDDALIEIPADPEATRLKEEALSKIKELQEEELEYNAFIEAAKIKYDEAIADGNNTATLGEAKTIYESAQNVRPQASLPQNKIVEIDDLLRKIEEEKASSNEAEIEQNYQDQLQLASVAAIDGKYANAIEYLKEAQKIKPNETFPSNEILKFQAIIDNASAEKELNANYTATVLKADLAFENGEFENSIQLYNEALGLKSAENYPKTQIAKAEEAIKNLAANSLDKEYQNFVDKGDAQFLNKEYDKALNSYQSALSVKEDDIYAKDKSDEIRQILDNLLKLKRENESQKEQFNQFIAEADQLFKGEKYLEAKSVYEKALNIDVNDAYTNKQIKLSIERAQAKAAANKEKRYNQTITTADGFFNSQEYEKAIEAYKRAISLRDYEQYPKTKLAEIESIKNANAKAQGSVEYLGEQSNISILEGAALLQQGEIDRERLKQGIVSKQLTQYEGEAANRALSDFDERLQYENQVTSLKDLREKANQGEQEMKSTIVNQVDGQMYSFEQKSAQMNKYKEGELSRASQDLVFINDDFDQEKADYRSMHKDAIEQIKEVEYEKDVNDLTEAAHNAVKVTSTNQELEKIEDGYNPSTDSREEYNKVVEMQDESILAEIKVAESTKAKAVVQQQLKEDIIAYEAELQRKLSDEAGTVHAQQIKIDDQLTDAEKQFTESQIGKDDERLRAVEQLKEVDQDQYNQVVERSTEQVNKAQENSQEVEAVLDLQAEKARQNEKDLTVIDNDVKNREETFERGRKELSNEKRQEIEATENELLRIENKEAILHSEKVESVKENYDELKNQEIRRENADLMSGDQASKKKQATQKYVDALESNKVKFNETIANTIGDDYPEGVTQENYVRKDSKGIPVKIVTRRIVVTDGRGEVYIRTQTKVGLTYSKNGSPVTEQTWIYGTENAKLEKHY
ncbi:hypothetical protein [Brumimicrobium mesophilum]|uniref:hypothetical protein n=1 Tax=Brumimicrobium mesophilum TaxID=392717 RepID=UPI001F3C7EBF|nr:hypothetical protein [Brumimicrobium mesophilum]